MRASHSGCEWAIAAPSGVPSSSCGEQRRGLARGTAQHGVDEPAPPRSPPPPRAPCLASSTASATTACAGAPLHKAELVEPEPERRSHGRVETPERPLGELLDQVVEGRAALDGAIGEAHREAAVARAEPAGLGLKRAIGVGAALEDASQHEVRAAPGGRRAAAAPLARHRTRLSRRGRRGRAGRHRRPSACLRPA